MTKEDKQLLLQDLCARLPYRVKANSRDGKKIITITPIGIANFMSGAIDIIKPYLRPMNSMTDEEKKEYNIFFEEYAPDDRWPHLTKNFVEEELVSELIDWLNKKMFDYRGLIEKGLAIEVTENNNPYID